MAYRNVFFAFIKRIFRVYVGVYESGGFDGPFSWLSGIFANLFNRFNPIYLDHNPEHDFHGSAYSGVYDDDGGFYSEDSSPFGK